MAGEDGPATAGSVMGYWRSATGDDSNPEGRTEDGLVRGDREV
jgi:hypothetical protein